MYKRQIPDNYQVIDLSPYRAIALNDIGDVLLGEEITDTVTPVVGTSLVEGNYFLWRDLDRDSTVDHDELTLVCHLRSRLDDPVQPQNSFRQFQGGSSNGCRPVAVNNEGQVLATQSDSLLEVINCSDTQCELKLTARTSALRWQLNSPQTFDGLSPVNTGAAGSMSNDLRVFSLNDNGAFTGAGIGVDPQREAFLKTPFSLQRCLMKRITKRWLVALLIATSFSAFAEAPERVLWDKTPISVHIQLGEERIIHFPDDIRYWLPDSIQRKVTVLAANGVLYILSLIHI